MDDSGDIMDIDSPSFNIDEDERSTSSLETIMYSTRFSVGAVVIGVLSAHVCRTTICQAARAG